MRVGQFRILKTLGVGGMGEVFAARDERLDRTVALKSIRAERRMSRSARGRFVREARVLSLLEHPNICRLYDFLESRDRDYLVLELIDGEPLSARAAGLTRGEKLRVAGDVARALVAAHGAGVIHRDLKPDNIMITRSGEAKVLDFGIARPAAPGTHPDEAADDDWVSHESTHSLFITRRAGAIGTPMYMSPEQARGEEATAASDIYSFGLVIDEIFTGRAVRDATKPVAALLDEARRAERVDVRGLDGDIQRLVRRMTDPKPSARPSAADVLRSLEHFKRRPVRRTIAAVGAAVLLIAVLGAAKYFVDLSAEVGRTQRALASSDRLLITMLDDFGATMQDLGRFDVMERIAGRVEEHFADREESAPSPLTMARRAKAIMMRGDVAQQRGDRAEAASLFPRALAMLLTAHEAAPTDTYILKELGVAQYNLGELAYSAKNYPLAKGWFEAQHRTERRRCELSGDDDDARFGLAEAMTNLQVVYEIMDEPERALTLLQESIGVKRSLVEACAAAGRRDEQWRQWSEGLANGLSYLAEALEAQNDLAGAVAAVEEETAVLRPVLEAVPGNASVRRIQATALSVHGNLLSRTGRNAEARDRFREMYRVTEQLLEIEPENTTAARERAIAFQQIARECVALGELDEAQSAVNHSKTQLAALIEKEPGTVRWILDLVDTERGGAAIALARGDREAAVLAAERIRGHLDPLASSGQGEPAYEIRLARLEMLEGRLAHLGGDEAAAHAKWQDALEWLASVGDVPTDASLAEPSAVLLLYLGRLDEARPLVEGLRKQGRQTFALEQLARERGL